MLPVLTRMATSQRRQHGKPWVYVCAHGAIVVTETLVCARQCPPQFPLRPYNAPQFLSRTVGYFTAMRVEAPSMTMKETGAVPGHESRPATAGKCVRCVDALASDSSPRLPHGR
jgi:hypothetical protein